MAMMIVVKSRTVSDERLVWSDVIAKLHQQLLELVRRPEAIVVRLLVGTLEEFHVDVLAEDWTHRTCRRPRHLIHQQRNYRLSQRHRQIYLKTQHVYAHKIFSKVTANF